MAFYKKPWSPSKPLSRAAKGASIKNMALEDITYKNYLQLSSATSAHGRILPRRLLGTTAKAQRKLGKAIKRARLLALMPFC